MDVSAEAKRIMVQALSKMYSSRTQRGGLRLHRSLLLTLVMKSAREMYHGARAAEGDKENQGGRGPAASDRRCRKRLGQATSEPDFLPCKKAKMDPEGLRRAAGSDSRRGTALFTRSVIF
uniref:Immediate early response gene 2 protein n=1 Tax=Denticeps clupeoides TaxID=299321 RepID=A0AAY4BS84_9TELE